MWAGIVVLAFFLGFVVAQVNLVAGMAVCSACLCAGLLFFLEQIAGLLQSQKDHNVWIRKIEAYRFEHDHPNADAIVAQREAVKADAKNKATEELLAKRGAKKTARAEAKQKAKEPTFVGVEAVPDVPADFKASKKTPNVDFSAIDEVSKPRRKST